MKFRIQETIFNTPRHFHLSRLTQLYAIFHASSSPAHQMGTGLQNSADVNRRLNPVDTIKISEEARRAAKTAEREKTTTVMPVKETTPHLRLIDKDEN